MNPRPALLALALVPAVLGGLLGGCAGRSGPDMDTKRDEPALRERLSRIDGVDQVRVVITPKNPPESSTPAATARLQCADGTSREQLQAVYEAALKSTATYFPNQPDTRTWRVTMNVVNRDGSDSTMLRSDPSWIGFPPGHDLTLGEIRDHFHL